MHIHSTRITREILTPYLLQKRIPAIYLAGMAHKEIKHLEFFAREIYLFAFDEKTTAVCIYTDISALKSLLWCLCMLGSPENCLHSRTHLKDIERLRDLVICPILQSHYLVHVVALGCKHDDRNLRLLPDTLADLISIYLREHKIK